MMEDCWSRSGLNKWLQTPGGGSSARTQSPGSASVASGRPQDLPPARAGVGTGRVFGLPSAGPELLSDDTAGCALSRVFDAGWATALDDLGLRAVRESEADCTQLGDDAARARVNGPAAHPLLVPEGFGYSDVALEVAAGNHREQGCQRPR